MSAPKFVNTTDGMCWTRREATRDGRELYALEAVEDCPAHLMETYAELEGHGIVGSADALPVPVGPKPRSRVLDRARNALGARMSKDDLRLVLENTIAYAAELESDLATANDVLEDVAKARRTETSCPCPPEDPPAPHQVGCFFDGVPVSPPSERPMDGPSPLFPTVASLREVSSREEPHDSPLHHPYRVGHDLPATGGEHRG